MSSLSVDRRGCCYDLQGIRTVRDPRAQVGHLWWPHRYPVDREHEHGAGWQQKGTSQGKKCLNKIVTFENILLYIKPQVQAVVPDFWKEQVQDGVGDKLWAFFLVHFDWFGFLVCLGFCIGIIITIFTHCWKHELCSISLMP